MEQPKGGAKQTKSGLMETILETFKTRSDSEISRGPVAVFEEILGELLFVGTSEMGRDWEEKKERSGQGRDLGDLGVLGEDVERMKEVQLGMLRVRENEIYEDRKSTTGQKIYEPHLSP
jgi:hypothetical protein